MKRVNLKKGRYFTIIVLILTVFIFGSVKLDYLNVQAESMDPGDEDKLLEIIQGDFVHRFVRGSEGLTFQLDVKDAEPDVQYDWQILVPPMHGGAIVFETGKSTEVSYVPAENFFGEDNFLVEVSTATGNRSKINVAVTVAPGEAQPERANLPNPEGVEIAFAPNVEPEQKYPGDMAPERYRIDKPGIRELEQEERFDPRQTELDTLGEKDRQAQLDEINRSSDVEGERGDPYFKTYPLEDHIYGYGWTPNTPITLTIDSTVIATENSSDYGNVYFYLDPFDVLSGQVVEMTDGTYTRTHTVTSLTVTDIDEVADTVSGTAAAESEISISAHDDNGWDYLYPIADSFGDWNADFSGLVDIASGSYGYARQYDAEGNSTNIRWYIPDPYIGVYPEWDDIDGYDWTPNTSVTLSIGTQEWIKESNEDGWVWFDTYPFDITAGQVVEMTDSTYTRTHTVTSLTITDIDEVADTVSGTAAAESEISISAHDDNGWDYLSPIADSFGDWNADFSGLVDIASGVYGYARQYDGEGNSTNIRWNVPDPVFRVYPEGDDIYGDDWTPNTLITLSIGTQEWNKVSSESGWVGFYLYPFDIVAGQIVTMTDGTYTRTHTVTSLTITDIDEAADTVSGTAAAESEISISAHDEFGWDDLSPIADSFGDWNADFSGLVDIASGSYGYARQYDAEGNSTRIYWNVPDPVFRVYPEWDDIDGYDWTPSTSVTLNIGTQEWSEESDESGWVSFYLYPFDIVAGQIVTMTDGTYIRTHTVTNLTITDVDEVADSISGTAEPGSDIEVDGWDGYDWDELTVTADGAGDWTAAFISLDIAPGSGGYASQYDAEGNSTNIRWYVPDPLIQVYPEWDDIDGYDWTPNTTITLTIGTQEWMKESNEGGWVWFDTYPFDITAGQLVKMTDGTNIRTHTVTSLTVTDIDEVLDTVSGTAEVGSEVYVDGWDDWDWEPLTVTADGDGDWTAAFTYLDIAPGAGGYASQYDAEGNSTNIYWFVADPRIQAYPLGDYVKGYEWAPDSLVTLNIDSSYSDTGYSDIDGWVYFDLYPFDLLPGQVVEMSDGSSTRTHIVKNLAIVDVDEDLDVVNGTADEFSEITTYACDDYNCHWIYPTADDAGNWSADFSGYVDIAPGVYGWAYRYDDQGNSTRIYWRLREPAFEVHPGDDYIFGWDWTPNTPVTLEIDSTLIATEDSDFFGYVGFFPEAFDIQPGQDVVLSDGTYTKTHTVIDLAVTDYDEVADTLSGTADPGMLTINAYDDYNWETLYPEADASGDWTANFTTVDITEGARASIYQSDDDNDLTFIYWLIPDPKISARPQDDAVYGFGWPQNTDITLTIEYTRETLVEVETSSEYGSVYFILEPFDLQPGDIVEMTAGTYIQTHTVRDISVTEIDQVLDTVSGTADPGSEVQVCADYFDGYYWYYTCITTTADGSGNWLVDFSGSVDISVGSWIGVYQYDENDNYTYIYWEVSDEAYQIFLPLIVH